MSPVAPLAHLLRRQAVRRDTCGRQSGPLGVICMGPGAGTSAGPFHRTHVCAHGPGPTTLQFCRFGLQERLWTSGTVREPSIRAVAVLSTGRAGEGVWDQRQSPSWRRTSPASSGWIGAKVGPLMTGLEGDDVVSSFVAVAFTGEAVAIEGKVAMTAAFGGLWAARAGIVRVLLVEGLVAARSARWWVPPASC
jgi:hypothetical protein